MDDGTEAGGGVEDLEDMKTMMKKMMKMMTNVEGKMDGLEKVMGEVRAAAGKAVETAEGAKKAVEDMRAEIKEEVRRMSRRPS